MINNKRLNMKTSVIMATYNGERYIQEQLNSIISQTVLPSEIVISDDGSSDKTSDIIWSIIHQNEQLPISFLFIQNDPDNSGVVGNFENAVRHSHGEYIFFCDQDDIWVTTKIEKTLSAFEKTSDSVIIHNAQVIVENNEGTFSLIDQYLMGNYPFDENGLYKINGPKNVWGAFYHCLIQGMCICVKRDYLFSIIPFSRGLNHDNWLLFCALADDTITAVNDILALYRMHNGNTCGISEFRKKRPFYKRLTSFDQNCKNSIKKQYQWYHDIFIYLDGREIKDDRVKLMQSFFYKERIKIVAKRKITATISLIKAFYAGVYSIDGKSVFFHDIAYVWMHTRKERCSFLNSFVNISNN